MSATGNTNLTFIIPTATTGRDPDRGETEEVTLKVWMKQISLKAWGTPTTGGRPSPVGIYGLEAYVVRFRAPHTMKHTPRPGWRARDDKGNEYQVMDVMETAGMYKLTMERA